MSSLERYQYSPLKRTNGFRLLKIFPPESRDQEESINNSNFPCTAKLLEYTLDSEIEYECLSYTWGAPSLNERIILDCKCLPITTNLSLAIEGSQKATKKSLIWIDAICINQEDPEEKAQQIQEMGTIFSKASQVIVFLGSEAEGSQNVPGFCEKIQKCIEKREKTMQKVFGGFSNKIWPEEFEGLGLPPQGDPAWAVLMKLVSRPWFIRVWIIQEVVLARYITLVCGDWTFPGVELSYSVRLCALHGLPLSLTEVARSTAADDGVMQVLMILDLIITHQIPPRQVLKPSLLDLIRRSRHVGATDKRDNLYGFLSLSKDQAVASLRPSYVESIVDTYSRFAT
ncbi:hypothetical protein MMC21_007170 [Puttea exsequens]|nr:hypothetical protein [Puttea exsequens]